MDTLPSPEDVLTNKDIQKRFSVSNQGGMRRSKKNNVLVLISNPYTGLYEDRWEGDILHYTGMGQLGDQSINSRQNKTLAESRQNGVCIHLFEARAERQYTYIGQVELSGVPYQEDQTDTAGKKRKVWIFPLRRCDNRSILIAADRPGYALKEAIKAALPQHAWEDLGTDNARDPVDYPDFGRALAQAIEQGRAARGVLICGTGIGISIAANRSPAVRCALATNTTMARLAREHNDANVLALGARLIAPELALEIVETFLTTPFDGGRHAARVAKL